MLEVSSFEFSLFPNVNAIKHSVFSANFEYSPLKIRYYQIRVL